MIWQARIHVGVFWDGPDYHLAYGSRREVHAAALRELAKYPLRRAHISRAMGAHA